jgi:hypothetical protein
MSLAIFTVSVTIFAACVPLTHQSSGANGQYAQAMSLCQHKIDECRAAGWGSLKYSELNNREIIDPIDSTATPRSYHFEGIDGVAGLLGTGATARLTVEDQTQTVGATTLTYTKVVATITWKNRTYKTKQSTAAASGYIANVD